MLLNIQGTVMFEHLFGIMLFTKLVVRGSRPYNLMVKAKISETAVAVTALIGGVSMSSRVFFMYNTRTICLDGDRMLASDKEPRSFANGEIATPTSTFTGRLFITPAYLLPHLLGLMYVLITLGVTFHNQPKVAIKGVGNVRKLLEHEVWSNVEEDSYKIICEDSEITPFAGHTPTAAEKKLLTKEIRTCLQNDPAADRESFRWKWTNLYDNLRRHGMLPKDIIDASVKTYVEYFDVVWGNIFYLCYIVSLWTLGNSVALFLGGVSLFQPQEGLTHGLFGINMGWSEYHVIAFYQTFIALGFCLLCYISYLQIISLHDWPRKICLHKSEKTLYEYMGDRCDRWTLCMKEVDGKETSKVHSQDPAYLDRSAVCWSLAMNMEDIPLTMPFY